MLEHVVTEFDGEGGNLDGEPMQYLDRAITIGTEKFLFEEMPGNMDLDPASGDPVRLNYAYRVVEDNVEEHKAKVVRVDDPGILKQIFEEFMLIYRREGREQEESRDQEGFL